MATISTEGLPEQSGEIIRENLLSSPEESKVILAGPSDIEILIIAGILLGVFLFSSRS